MTRLIAWAESKISPPIKILHVVGYIVLFILMLLTVADIVGRKFAGVIPGSKPVPGSFELTEYALIIIIFASIGVTQRRGEHISIDILTSHLPKRMQAALNSVTLLAGVVMFALVAWQAFVYAGRLRAGHNISAVLEVPQYPFAIIVGVGSIIYCLAALLDVLKNLAKTAGGETLVTTTERRAPETEPKAANHGV